MVQNRVGVKRVKMQFILKYGPVVIDDMGANIRYKINAIIKNDGL